MSEKVAKFKIGDKVRVTKDNTIPSGYGLKKGDIVTILEVGNASEDGINYTLIVSDDGNYLFDTEVIHVRCKNTRLARKLYPKANVSECGEWIYV